MCEQKRVEIPESDEELLAQCLKEAGVREASLAFSPTARAPITQRRIENYDPVFHFKPL